MDKNLEYDMAMAKFMGWQIDNSFPDKGRVWRSAKGDLELDTTFKFSIDWNKLMPVYEAVNRMNKGYHVEIHVGSCLIYLDGRLHAEAGCEDTHEAVYNCLGLFLLKYNETKNV